MSTDTAFGLEFASTPSADRRAAAEREQILADPGFGKHFTDHMATVEWTLDEEVPLGAPAIYRNIRHWLSGIGIELGKQPAAEAPATVEATPPEPAAVAG
jgi:hypothetical protein